eukprot:gene11577-6541_t
MTQADAKLLSTRGVGKGLAREVVRAFRCIRQTPCALADCRNKVLIVRGDKTKYACSKECKTRYKEQQAQGKAGGAKGGR